MRTEIGPAGSAIEVDVSSHPTTVACWFLRCPKQSPAWDSYVLAIIHLRPVEGMRDAEIRVPHATHEVMLHALDPELSPAASNIGTWRFLSPTNVSEQVQLDSDEQAVELLYGAARAVVSGLIPAEPALSGAVEPWRTALIKSSAHLRGEEHAS